MHANLQTARDRRAVRTALVSVAATAAIAAGAVALATAVARDTDSGSAERTVRAVKALSYRANRRAGRVRVTVSAGGAARTFVLRHGSRRELREFGAPPTRWRIDSGVDPLVRR